MGKKAGGGARGFSGNARRLSCQVQNARGAAANLGSSRSGAKPLNAARPRALRAIAFADTVRRVRLWTRCIWEDPHGQSLLDCILSLDQEPRRARGVWKARRTGDPGQWRLLLGARQSIEDLRSRA